jgi:hypothetical protein
MRFLILVFMSIFIFSGVANAGINKTQTEWTDRTFWVDKKVSSGDMSDVEIKNYIALKIEVKKLFSEAYKHDRTDFYKKMKPNFVELGRIIKDGTKYNLFQRVPNWL